VVKPLLAIKNMRWIFSLFIAIVVAMSFVGCAPPPQSTDPLFFPIDVSDSYFPWKGHVKLYTLEAGPGDNWIADFDFDVNMSNLKLQKGVIEELVFVIVGEPVFDAKGNAGGLNATSISSLFTSAQIPLAYFNGIVPVRALGSRRGSPFEGTMHFPAEQWQNSGRANLSGRITIALPKDIPHGYYLPRVDIFAKVKGSNTPIDLGNLASYIGISDFKPDRLRFGRIKKYFDRPPPSTSDSMEMEQVLPEVKVGNPATPTLPWSISFGPWQQGVSGILPIEIQSQVGLLEREKFPAGLRVSLGIHTINPCLPTKVPRLGLSGTYIGRDGPPMMRTYFDLGQSGATAKLQTPLGKTLNFGVLSFLQMGQCGPVFDQDALTLDLQETGDYELVLEGTMKDVYGRTYKAGGTYRFTVAMPLSFSTAVKPGTNYLVGAAYPAAFHVNPGVPAEVRVQVSYYPNSDGSKKKEVLYSGHANRFGHFVPDQPPLRFDQPGEYRSHLEARYKDGRGNLWMGSQTSAGVIAPANPEIRVHGGRMMLSEDGLSSANYGQTERFDAVSESSFPYLNEPTYSGLDFLLPYNSGDTLFVAPTYPFESAVSNVLTMEATNPLLAKRIVDVYNPTNQTYNLPMFTANGVKQYLPDVVAFSEDDFGLYRISSEHPDQLPILFRNRSGISPYLFPEENEIEAYTYLSVIRPGFQVLSLAFSESYLQPYWIISPNPIEGTVETRPVGDLPGDIYRVMAGLVVKDKKSGKNYYDAYGAGLINVPTGVKPNSISAPGERPVYWINGQDQYYLMGMDTSQVMIVGEKLMLAGSVVPPTEANVQFTVTHPDGRVETLRGRSNRLGQLGPPRPVNVNQPGVYRIKVGVEQNGRTGDVAGSGDGEFFNFALPVKPANLLVATIPPVSRISALKPAAIPLSWPDTLDNVKITHSINMPGFVLDEGTRKINGSAFSFPIRLDQLAIQYPFLETVHYGTGKETLADTIIVVLFLEAEQRGEKVFDAVRLVIRRGMLMNLETVFSNSSDTEKSSLFPGNRVFFADP
jgi:hypothetical protein